MAKVRIGYNSDGSLVYTTKSGMLSNAINKELNRRSFELSTIPDHINTTGYEIDNSYEPFNDWTVINFTQQEVNNVIGLPLIGDGYSQNGINVYDASIYRSEEEASWIGDLSFIANQNRLDPTFKRNLSSLSIFGSPNTFVDFGIDITTPGGSSPAFTFFYNTKRQQITNKNVDDIIVKKEINRPYEPYNESLKSLDLRSSNWNEEEIKKAKNNKQITLNLDFSQTANAILTEANLYDTVENYTILENKTLSKSNRPTAYFNFNHNRWDYLSAGIDYYFPLDVTQDQNSGNKNNFIRDKASDFVHSRKVMSTPSYRTDSNNKSSFMKISSSYGFPNSRSWDPLADHLLDMSKYISSDFYLENIIIKFKVVPSMTLDVDNAVNPDNFAKGFYGMSFFLMRQVEEEEVSQESKLENFNFYVDANPLEFDPNGLYPQITTSLFDNLSLNSTINEDTNQIFEYKTTTSDIKLRGDSEVYLSLNDYYLGTDYLNGLGEVQYRNYFHYLEQESLGDSESQFKISNSRTEYLEDNFLNVYGVNSIYNTGFGKSSYRDIISVNNVMFVGEDTQQEFIDLISLDKNIDTIITRESVLNPDPKDVTLYTKPKKSYSDNYTDESKYIKDNNNITILEGNFSPEKSTRVYNEKIIKRKVDNNFINEIGYELIKEGQKDVTEEYQYLLKPDDKIIFGISSHGNGNIIASMTELLENIEIVLIGRDAEVVHGKNSSKSIRKTIDSISTLNENDKSISTKFIQKNNNFIKLNKNFIKDNNTFKEKIYDSVLPNLIEYFDLVNKSPSSFTISNNLYLNYSLSNHKKSNIVPEDVVENVLCYDELYDNYIFNQFSENSSFNRKRSTQKSILGTLQSKIDYSPYKRVNTHLGYSSGGVRCAKFNKFKSKLISPVCSFSQYLDFGGVRHLNKYTLPSYNKEKNNSILITSNDNTFKFLSSNQNYGIDLSSNAFYKSSVTIQKFRSNYYIVLHPGTNSALTNGYFSILVNAIKSLDGFEMVESNTFSNFISNSKCSKFTFPLTIRSLINVGSNDVENIILGRNDSSGFTKEFVLVEPDDLGTSCFVAQLEDWELVNIVNPYYPDLVVDEQGSFRSEVPERTFTNGVYDANCLIKNIIDNFVTYAEEENLKSGYDYFGAIINDNYSNQNGSFITLSDPSADPSLDPQSRFLSTAGNEIYVEFHLTKYKLKRNDKTLSNVGNIYKYENLIGKNYTSPLVENGKFLYCDDNIFELDFELKKEIYESAGKTLDKIPDFVNNEVIYHAECFYAEDVGSDIENVRKTNFDIIFKYVDFSYNGINFPQIHIYDIFNKSNKLQDYRFDDAIPWDFIDLPTSGFLRVYEPRVYNQYKLGYIKSSAVPYFQINLSDFSEALLNRKAGHSLTSIAALDFDLVTNNTVLLDDSSYNNIKPNSIEYTFGAWGSNENKDRFVNDTIYTYGKDYTFPIDEKNGYVYGVMSSSPLSTETYFNNYRYGQFSDHIKYTKNYVTLKTIRSKQQISYTVQKTFYNSTFEVVNNSELTQTYNKNYYSQSEYPFIENSNSQLSQINFDHPLYDANYVY